MKPKTSLLPSKPAFKHLEFLRENLGTTETSKRLRERGGGHHQIIWGIDHTEFPPRKPSRQKPGNQQGLYPRCKPFIPLPASWPARPHEGYPRMVEQPPGSFSKQKPKSPQGVKPSRPMQQQGVYNENKPGYQQPVGDQQDLNPETTKAYTPDNLMVSPHISTKPSTTHLGVAPLAGVSPCHYLGVLF